MRHIRLLYLVYTTFKIKIIGASVHSELMRKVGRSRVSRTVGQAKAPLVTLVLPLTNRTMPSFSSKDEK